MNTHQYFCKKCGYEREGQLDHPAGIGGYSWACPQCKSHDIDSREVIMTNEKTQLDKLLDYAESAMADGYPYEVIDGDLALTVKALRAFKASQVEPKAECSECVGGGYCWKCGRQQCGANVGREREVPWVAGPALNREVKP